MGLLIALSGFLMSSEIEADQMIVINMGLKQRVKQNFADIKITVPQIAVTVSGVGSAVALGGLLIQG